MNIKISRLVLTITTYASIVFLTGCASSPWSVSDSNVETQLVSSKNLKISRVVVFEKTDGISLRGEMYKSQLRSIKPKGHIDIDVIDSAGSVLHKRTAQIHRYKKTNGSRKHYKFYSDVSYLPPEGSIIRVAHHEAESHRE